MTVTEEDRLLCETRPELAELVRERAPYAGAKAAALVVHDVLRDLDRRWSVPPTLFAQELAREVVQALVRDPAVLGPLVDALARATAERLLEAATVAGARVAAELAAQGVRLRLEQGVLWAGPRERITAEVADTIRRRRAELTAALAG